MYSLGFDRTVLSAFPHRAPGGYEYSGGGHVASIQCTRGWRSPLWTGRPLNVVAALALRPKPSVIAGITGDLGGRSTRIGATAFNYTSRTVQTDDVSIILPFQYIYIYIYVCVDEWKKLGLPLPEKLSFFSLFLRFFAFKLRKIRRFVKFWKLITRENSRFLLSKCL